MTPKEKAEEILEKMQDKASNHDCFGNEYLVAKDCALIAVDEILDVITGNYDYDFEVLNPYWKEVKKEIEKL